MPDSQWRRFNHYLYRYWRLQASIIVLELISIPLSLLNPYLTKLIVDRAYGNKDLRLFFTLIAFGATVFLLNGLVVALSAYLAKRINRYVLFDLTRDVFQHLQRLSLKFFTNHSTGRNIYKIQEDVGSVSSFVCNNLPQAVTLFPRLIFILIIVFYLNWKLALLATVLAPLAYVNLYFFKQWLRQSASEVIESTQNVFERLHEVFSHIRLVKALSQEEHEGRKFNQLLAKRTDLELKRAKLLNISDFSSSILNRALGGVIALYGGYQVIKGALTLGAFSAIMIYLTQLTELLKLLGAFFQGITLHTISCQRLSEILDIVPEIQDLPNAYIYPRLSGQIVCQDVCFGYQPDVAVLRHLSFTVTPGVKIALVGPSGCGKTTLLSLMLRLYDPQQGAVLIDGIDIRRANLALLKSQMGVALQEPFLWNDTVANNILYGAEAKSQEAMIAAARMAEAERFIIQLPEQYNTPIGEMACRLSQGQKQRIALARALINRPRILILDEALSSVDAQTEEKIIDNIFNGLSDATLICVSHRLSTVARMELAYYLENPQSVQVNRHQQLMRSNQQYQQLFASQR